MVRFTTGYLADRRIEEPRLNAELLLADTLGLKRLELYLQFDRPLTPEELARYRPKLLRRAQREPLQYIAGEAAFRDLVLRVDRRVLIPRPETELLVGEILAWSRGRSGLSAVDVGTGSGAIALSLASEGEAFDRIVATDLSADALHVAEANLASVRPRTAVELRLGAGYGPLRGERFDVIVSNPPYVAETERGELEPEVVRWEPATALFGGDDGLAVIGELAVGAPAHLKPGGLLALEIGAGQAGRVRELLVGFASVVVKQDLAGRDRMVLAEMA